ncbi:hypothetical protein CJU90_5850 [Yarrowia sp. C11]|nr:hypothetical protein CJU90_5850 [Yarrowia sp. C11]KAG5364425.1 hypothetical protein CKK34_3228 [Yarrowia sp. E02]
MNTPPVPCKTWTRSLRSQCRKIPGLGDTEKARLYQTVEAERKRQEKMLKARRGTFFRRSIPNAISRRTLREMERNTSYDMPVMVPSRVWANTPSAWREELSTLRSDISQGDIPLLNGAIRGVGETSSRCRRGLNSAVSTGSSALGMVMFVNRLLG